MPPRQSDSLHIGARWIKKHGNVRTRMIVVDGNDLGRVLLRVVDSGGSMAYVKGREVTMDAKTLELYYAPAGR